LDVSKENLERVFAIKHPDEENHKQREKVREKLQAEQEEQKGTGVSEKCGAAAYAAVADVPESPGTAAKVVDCRAEERENELFYFDFVQDEEEDDGAQ